MGNNAAGQQGARLLGDQAGLEPAQSLRLGLSGLEPGRVPFHSRSAKGRAQGINPMPATHVLVEHDGRGALPS
jgi:hypothetical protein